MYSVQCSIPLKLKKNELALLKVIFFLNIGSSQNMALLWGGGEKEIEYNPHTCVHCLPDLKGSKGTTISVTHTSSEKMCGREDGRWACGGGGGTMRRIIALPYPKT